MNNTTETFQKFAKKSKAYDSVACNDASERKDKKQSYKTVRNLKRLWSEE